MKFGRRVLFILLFLIPFSKVQSSAASNPIDRDFVHVIEDDVDVFAFDVMVPLDLIKTEIVEIEGKKYSEVSVLDWGKVSEPGAPSLPFITEIIGIPFDSTIEINYTPGKFHEILLDAPVMPAITQSVNYGSIDPNLDSLGNLTTNNFHEVDPAYYTGSQIFPDELVTISNVGWIRQQRIAGLSIFPIQFNPGEHSLVFYETIRVEIDFNSSAIARKGQLSPDNQVYESFFESKLLNYQSAINWRKPFETQVDPTGYSIENNFQSQQISPWFPPENAWRIAVDDSGIYKLTYDDLLAAGVLDGSPDPNYFQMFYHGEEIAIEVNSGEDDVFNFNDTIIFFAESIENKYTSENIYWLLIGDVPGKRMTYVSSEPETPDLKLDFHELIHLEQHPDEFLYLSNAPGDDNLERLFWDYLDLGDPSSGSYSFYATAPVSNETGIIRIALLGYKQDYSINPDHHIEVNINAQFIGEAFWDGIQWKILELDIPPDVLVPGNNSITLNAPNDLGSEIDVIYLDWIELEYRNRFVSEDNKLDFTISDEGDHRIKIDGFIEDTINAYDTTDLFNVEKLDGGVIDGTNPYAFSFQSSIMEPKSYFIAADSALMTVNSITRDNYSNLRSQQNSAENIILTHSEFKSAAENLAEYRNDHSLSSMVVDIQDVYDEFGYGITGIQPIKDFLSYAYANWSSPKPSSVLLVGDGHFDPKNYLGFDRPNYIPALLSVVDPWRGETATDNRYVTFVGEDTLPDMMIGRLSVNTLDEATTLVNKIINYEENLPLGDWQRNLLAVADNPDSGGNFPYYSDRILEDSLPDDFNISKVYYGITHLDIGEAKAALINHINQGAAFVNYTGHAYYAGWASPTLMTTADIGGLNNGNMLPIVLSMTCNDGFFHYPNPYTAGRESMAEVFTRKSGGGSIANWSPTGMGLATGHEFLNRGFLEAVFFEGAKTIGEAALAGKLNLWATGANLDLVDTYTLFGDPNLRNIYYSKYEGKTYLPIIFKGY